MTKTNVEKLTSLIEKAHELSRTNPTQLALAYKKRYADSIFTLKASEKYLDSNTGGRVKLEEKLRTGIAEDLFKHIADEKAEYAKVYAEATKLAKTIQTTENEKPKDELAIKLFEQELEALKTETMLGLNAKRSLDAITAFVSKYDDPYYASVIKQNFSQLSQNVLSIESSMQNRKALSDVLDRVNDKATNEEQKAAAEALAYFGNGNPAFFLPGLAQYNALEQIVGKKAAEYLDKPNEWLETQAASAQAE